MLRALIPAIIIALAGTPTLAQNADWRFGGDAFVGGRSVVVSDGWVKDLFAAGQSVTTEIEVSGSAHMAAQRIAVEGRIGQNLYAMGQSVDIDAPIAGNVTVAGQNITVNEPVSGNIRAGGQQVDILAPVAGSALLGTEEVRINAAISGDLALGTQSVSWGEHASVGGEVHVYTDDPDSIEVPDRVADDARVFYHEISEFDEIDGVPVIDRPSFFERLRNWIGGVIAIGLLGTLFAAVAPGFLANLRARAIARPVFSGLVGSVGISALIGSIVLLAMTGFGILLIPLSILAAVLLALAGYVIGTYALGVWATGFAGRGEPASTGDRAIAAFTGAAVGALVCMIPWIGWLAVMAIFLIGAGALVARTIRLEREDLAT